MTGTQPLTKLPGAPRSPCFQIITNILLKLAVLQASVQFTNVGLDIQDLMLGKEAENSEKCRSC